MISLVADENLNNDIVRGVLRHNPGIDLVRVQDVGLGSAPDSQVLTWAAEQGRILLTHDINTIPAEAYARVRASLPLPGVFVIPTSISVGDAIEQIMMLEVCSSSDEWESQVIFLPL
jgi:Domain of unknown function (DUF5615)